MTSDHRSRGSLCGLAVRKHAHGAEWGGTVPRIRVAGRWAMRMRGLACGVRRTSTRAGAGPTRVRAWGVTASADDSVGRSGWGSWTVPGWVLVAGEARGAETEEGGGARTSTDAGRLRVMVSGGDGGAGVSGVGDCAGAEGWPTVVSGDGLQRYCGWPATHTSCGGVCGGVWTRAGRGCGSGPRLTLPAHAEGAGAAGGATWAREQPVPEHAEGPKSGNRPHTCLLPARREARDGTAARARAQDLGADRRRSVTAVGHPDVETSWRGVAPGPGEEAAAGWTRGGGVPG